MDGSGSMRRAYHDQRACARQVGALYDVAEIDREVSALLGQPAKKFGLATGSCTVIMTFFTLQAWSVPACVWPISAVSRPSGEWSDDDYDVLSDGVVVGRIMKAMAAPVGAPWLWTFGYHEDRIPTHGYEPTREGAMTAFAMSWRQE
jgi:hypothetical protein